jgi:hypothetical protein
MYKLSDIPMADLINIFQAKKQYNLIHQDIVPEGVLVAKNALNQKEKKKNSKQGTNSNSNGQ